MKVIDLLNKIANGESIENCKIKFKGDEPELVNEYIIYDKLYEDNIILNDEVEIIEEDKKIEKLSIQKTWQDEFRNEALLRYMYKEDIEDIENKINELIEEIEKLKGKSE